MQRLCNYALLLSILLLAGCSKDQAVLVGSLGDFYSLQHEVVRARLYPNEQRGTMSGQYSELAIEYVRENNEVPVRLTLLAEPALEVGSYDIKERGEISGRTDGVEIPRFRIGELRLIEFSPNPDTRIRGEFEATFDTGKDVASLAGEFDTTLTVIDRVPGYDVDVSFIDVQQFRE